MKRLHVLLTCTTTVAAATLSLQPIWSPVWSQAAPAPARSTGSTLPTTPLQPAVAIIDLPSSIHKTSETLGAILGLKQVSGGRVLVNDAGRRQIKLYDSTLSKYSLMADSAAGMPNSYGRVQVPFLQWQGDSSLFLDFDAQALLVLDGNGEVKRTIAIPGNGGRGGMSAFMRPGGSVDSKGRLVYRSPNTTMFIENPGTPGTPGSMSITQAGDSSEILRFDMDARKIDTVGRIAQLAGGLSSVRTPSGQNQMKRTINPLRSIDEWAVLSDGTIAFVRGHDYHVDWVLPDGSKRATQKLPFDWKRLTDADKQKLVDSAKTADSVRAAQIAQQRASGTSGDGNSNGSQVGSVMVGGMARGGGGGGGGGGGDGGGSGRGPAPLPTIVEYAALSDIADYYPPIRAGAAIADRDGNLWVLPTTSAQSRNGELVYDVLNPRDALFARVRVPLGKSIAGFGKNGVVYLMSGSRTAGFTLEKSVLPVSVRKTTQF